MKDYVMIWKHYPYNCPLVRESTSHWWIPHKGSVMLSFDVSFVVSLNQLLSQYRVLMGPHLLDFFYFHTRVLSY